MMILSTITLKLDERSSDTVTKFEDFYVLAGLGGGILVLTLCVIIMCICVCLWLAKRKRQGLTFTTDNVYTIEDDGQPLQQSGK